MREARSGDRYLLCSDGLSGVVSAETLAEALTIADPQDCSDRLIELALKGGGPDNVTCIVADVVDVDYGEHDPIYGGAAGDGRPDRPPGDSAAARASAATLTRSEPESRPAPAVSETPRRGGAKRGRLRLALAALAVVALALHRRDRGEDLRRQPVLRRQQRRPGRDLPGRARHLPRRHAAGGRREPRPARRRPHAGRAPAALRRRHPGRGPRRRPRHRRPARRRADAPAVPAGRAARHRAAGRCAAARASPRPPPPPASPVRPRWPSPTTTEPQVPGRDCRQVP